MTLLNKAKAGFETVVLRGGRVTKWKGRDASIAPHSGSVSLVSRSALAVGLALGGALFAPSAAWAGTCVQSPPGTWVCSGAAGVDTAVTATAPAATPVTVTTTPGFGINVTGAGQNAITIIGSVGTTGLTFTDVNGSSITGTFSGISALNNGTGALSVTSTGTATGTNRFGIFALQSGNGTNLDVTSNNATGGYHGIRARNYGNGALSVTSTGTATGTNGYGIFAYQSSYGTSLDVSSNNATGGRDGIHARNFGTDALSITSTGTATGTSRIGIFAYQSGNGTSLDVTSNNATGGQSGIDALNFGTDALSITSTGTATGMNRYGIRALQSSYGTSLDVSSNNATGGRDGIDALNFGSGALSVTSTGTATGTTGYGIRAYQSGNGTSLDVTSNNATGGYHGIRARNYGNGALSVTSTGTATGTSRYGIYALQSSYGTSLDVSSNNTTGGQSGIFALNFGTDALSITSTGTATGTSRIGIFAYQSGNGTSLDVTSNNATGGYDGIHARNYGTGALSVTSTGTATGTTFDGIYAFQSGNGTSLTITTGGVTTGGDDGIDARNFGTGGLTITANADVTGQSGMGIRAYNSSNDTTASMVINQAAGTTTTGAIDGINANNAGGSLTINALGTSLGTTGSGIDATNQATASILTVNANNATGAVSAIVTRGYGTGNTAINLTGTAQGGTGAAIDTYTGAGDPAPVAGSLTTINLAATSQTLAGASGIAIRNNAGNSLLAVASGAVITGEVRLGDGSDLAGLAGANALSTITVLDGGDDFSAADGMIDVLTLNGVTQTLNTGQIVNWEVINLNVSSITGELLAGTINVCGGSTTLNGNSAVTDVLGCVSADSITVTGNTVIANAIEGAGGADTINVLGNASVVTVRGGGNGSDASAAADTGDLITINTTGTVGIVDGQLGNDSITHMAGTTGSLLGNAGNDTILVSGGTVTLAQGDDGDDLLTVSGGSVGTVNGSAGNDTLSLTGGAVSVGLFGGTGNDTLSLTGGTAVTAQGNDGDDAITLAGSTVSGSITGDAGADTMLLNSGSAGSVAGGADNDSIVLAGATVTGAVDGGTGNDLITLNSGTAGSVLGGDGDDAATWNAGNASIATNINMGLGSDTLAVSNGAGGIGGTVLDGGDDFSAADGMIDVLTLNGVTQTLNTGQIVNWEVINLNVSSITGELLAGTINVCGGSTTLNGNSAVTDVLGCVSADSITVTGNTVIANAIEGAGGADTINVLGNASVVTVRGGGNGSDASAAADTGDLITINTTGTVGIVDGQLGNDSITHMAGTTGSLLGNAGNDTILVSGGTVTLAQGDDGDDLLTVSGGSVGTVNGSAGNDTLSLTGGAVSVGLFGGTGNDTLSLTGGTAVTAQGNDGDDAITLAGSTVSGSITGDAGADTMLLNSGSAGSVAGGADNDSIVLAGATVTGAVDGGTGNDLITLNSGTAGSVLGGDGNDTINWNAATLVTPLVNGGNGSDVVNINTAAAPISTGVVLNGGDDVSSADGMIDTLNLNAAWSGSLTGANTTNWEVINVGGGTVRFSDAAITAGTINVNAGGTLDGSNSLQAVSNVNITTGAKLVAGNAAGTNAMRITGNLTNAGTVQLTGPTGQQATGDKLTVTGNYAGAAGSALVFDTKLGGTNASDQLVVGGNLTGLSNVTVNNVGGTGSLTTGDGIKLVDVTGTSSGTLTLNSPNQRIDVGAFRYTLNLGGVANPADQDWYLRSRARDIVPLAETMGRLGQDLGLGALGTLHERVGEQEHLGQQASAAETSTPGGLWGRALGSDYSANMTSASYGDVFTNGKFGGLQMGLDFVRWGGSDGSRTVLGAYGGYLWSGTDDWLRTSGSRQLAGKTRSDGGFAGAYLTHYAPSGWYADLVVQGNWLTHKASAVDGTTLQTKGNTYLASLEVGKPFELGGGWKLEPQVQVIYGNSNLDNASDSTAIANSWTIDDTVTGRAGFRLKRTWDYNQSSEGGLFTAYLKANVWGRLSGDDTVLAVGVSTPGSFKTRNAWGDVGFGTTFSLSKTAEFFFDGDVEFSLDKARGGTALSGHTGFRLRF
jgi:outer membrane autotransporter protein